jgi:uncharacterized protein (TIGR03382 family)
VTLVVLNTGASAVNVTAALKNLPVLGALSSVLTDATHDLAPGAPVLLTQAGYSFSVPAGGIVTLTGVAQVSDAGVDGGHDAGTAGDAGDGADAGVTPDAGTVADAGVTDAGVADAGHGEPDAGQHGADAGTFQFDEPAVGSCGCGPGSGSATWLLAFLVAQWRRKRA